MDGQQLNYFDYHTNRLHEVQILEKKPQKVLVMDLDSKHVFTIRYYMLDIEAISVDRLESKSVDRTSFGVGDMVSFFDKNGNRLVGKITRLNPKRVSLTTTTGARWLVHYSHLTPVFDGHAVIDVLPMK